MKTVKNLLLIYVLSFVCAFAATFVNDDAIANNTFLDRLGETAVISIPVFFVLSFLYAVSRLLSKTAKALKKKKPPVQEGSQKN